MVSITALSLRQSTQDCHSLFGFLTITTGQCQGDMFSSMIPCFFLFLLIVSPVQLSFWESVYMGCADWFGLIKNSYLVQITANYQPSRYCMPWYAYLDSCYD